MPSDLQAEKGTLPRPVVRLHSSLARDRNRQRNWPLLKLALVVIGLLCIVLWHVRPALGLAFSEAFSSRIFDEDSSIGALKAYIEERAGLVQPSILDPYLLEQRLLAAASALLVPADAASALGETKELSVESFGGVPVKHGGLKARELGLFLLWPTDLESSTTSSFLLQSYLASPTSEVAHLIILIKGDASTCRKHTRRIQANKMAVVNLGRTHDRGLQTACFTDSEWLKHHKDFLCSGWDCSAEDEERVEHAMAARERDDVKDEQLRPLRGLAFDSLLPEGVKWWGWLGDDVYVGNLPRTLPWDIADNFDVVIPNGVALDQSSPVTLSSKLALFQRRKLTASLLLGLPAFASVTTYVEGQRPTLQDFSDYLLSSHEASFLSFEAHLTTFGAATFARALTQSGTFTILLPPSNRAEPTAHDRSGYLRLMHSAHVAPHLLGMFSEHGVHRTLSWDEPAVFPPLSATAGDFPSFDGRIRNSTVWLYRLSGGGPIVARSEPRLSQSQNIVLTEWALDTARNHQTSPPQPPPYPPNRLRQGHALVFLPDPKTSSASTVRVKEVIWDDRPAGPGAAANWWESGEYQTLARDFY